MVMLATASPGSVTLKEFTVIPEVVDPNCTVVTPATKPDPVKLTFRVSPCVPLVGLKRPPWTTSVAVEVLPAPVCVEVTVTLLLSVPVVVPITLKEIVQEAPAAKLPADKLAEEVPEAPVTVPPQPLSVKLLGVATASPAGKLSANEMPDKGVAELRLLMVNVKLVTPFKGMLAAPNVLVICGGNGDVAIVKVAVATGL